MSERTAIEWADSTFNPWIGCTRVSPACDHCYAEAQMATRMGRVEWGAGKPRSRTSAAYWRQPVQWNARADTFRECGACGWRGDIIIRAEPIPMPCPRCGAVDHRPARRRVFCASLADVFDNEVGIAWLADLLLLIYSTPNLDWLLLTKRIGNVRARLLQCVDLMPIPYRAFLIGWCDGIPLANVWIGATVVNQSEADRDIPKLLAVPAAKRFLSIEPMLGPVDLMPMFEHRADAHSDTGIDWIICGGESGPHARPMHPDWVRSLRDQCAAAGVPFLFKQWGEWAPYRLHVNGDLGGDLRSGRVQHLHAPGNPEGFFRRGDSYVERVGKRGAGRKLDGREHSEWPA